jgi:hypothetical protein
MAGEWAGGSWIKRQTIRITVSASTVKPADKWEVMPIP